MYFAHIVHQSIFAQQTQSFVFNVSHTHAVAVKQYMCHYFVVEVFFAACMALAAGAFRNGIEANPNPAQKGSRSGIRPSGPNHYTTLLYK